MQKGGPPATTSTLRVEQTIGDVSTVDEKKMYSVLKGSKTTVADVFAAQPGVDALAVTLPISAHSNSGQQGLMIFFRPSGVCTGSDTFCKEDNESLIFHEGLHNFYGFSDKTIQGDLGLPISTCTGNISDYIAEKVLGPDFFARCP
jgi:hypothetical protein